MSQASVRIRVWAFANLVQQVKEYQKVKRSVFSSDNEYFLITLTVPHIRLFDDFRKKYFISQVPAVPAALARRRRRGRRGGEWLVERKGAESAKVEGAETLGGLRGGGA